MKMKMKKQNKTKPIGPQLVEQLNYLKLPFIKDYHQELSEQAAQKNWGCIGYLEHLIQGEVQQRTDKRITRRIAMARFPVIKTLDQFDWNWPKKVDQTQIKNLFRLAFVKEKSNVGLGKTHLATALAYQACLKTYSVLFTTAVDIINTLSAAQATHRLKQQLKKYITPEILLIDELGYIPIDKGGADLLFQVFSLRYESGSTILTTNTVFKKWSKIFNNDSTLTSALLDRLLHHATTVTLEGKSYRMKDRISELE